MRCRAYLFIALGLWGNHAPAQAQTVLAYRGLTWESGGFPADTLGSTLSIVGTTTNLTPVLGVNLGVSEVTVWATGMTSALIDTLGPSTSLIGVGYVDGTIEFWQDPLLNATLKANPPNDTVPSTFSDGTLLLGGWFSRFTVIYDASTGSGNLSSTVHFTEGTALNLVGQDLLMYGYLSDSSGPDGGMLEGYDLECDVVLVRLQVSVENTTWGRVKALYRR